MGSDGTQRMGRRPSRKSDYAQRTDNVNKDTAREGRQCERERQTRPTQRKRQRAHSGHSKRAAARPSAKADKDSTKKERGMEWASDSYRASNRGTYARQVSEPRKGKNTGERAQNSQRLAATVRTTSKRAGSYRARREASDRGSKPI